MPTSAPPTDPDGLAVLHALSREGLGSEDAYNALEGLRNMTGRDVHARLDALESKLESKIDTLRTMITWGLAALGLLMAALRLFG